MIWILLRSAIVAFKSILLNKEWLCVLQPKPVTEKKNFKAPTSLRKPSTCKIQNGNKGENCKTVSDDIIKAQEAEIR